MKSETISSCIAAFGLVLFSLTSGCGSSSLPNSEHIGGPRGPQVAIEAARAIFESRFARKGSNYFTVKVITHPDTTVAMGEYMRSAMDGRIDFDVLERDFHPQLLHSMELIELKGVRTRIEGHELSEADRLNGISWKGRVVVETESERRRDLDLNSALGKLAGGDVEAKIAWTEKPIYWRPSESARANLEAYLEQAENESKAVPHQEILARVWGMLGEQVLDSFLEGYAQTEWCDWWAPEGSAYQVSEIVVRDGKAQITTMESIENVISDQESVALYMPESSPGNASGLFGSILAAGILETQDSFLLRPDMDALMRFNLLE